MSKGLTALMEQMNKEQKTNSGGAEQPTSPDTTPIDVRDVVQEAQSAEAIEIFTKKDKLPIGTKSGDTVTIGQAVLKMQTELTPEELKYVPQSTNYIDNNGVLEDIAKFVSANIPVLVEGETGVGKTSAFRYLASVTQTPYRRLNLNGSTTVDEFVGKLMLNEKGTYWQDGVLIEAMRKGHWLVLDEVNAALPEILFVLHSLLDDDRMVVLSENDGEVVRPHERFRVFATMNPSEGGYNGTKELNIAFLDRFVKTEFDFPGIPQERKMVNGRYPNLQNISKQQLTEMLHFVSETRTAYKKGAAEFIVSPRGTLQWVELAELFGDIVKGAEYALISKAPAEERAGIRDLLKMRFGMGIQDYLEQCEKNREYEEGDEVVVRITTDDDSTLATDFYGLYSVERKDDVRPDDNGEKDLSRISYGLKCLGKNQQRDMLSSDEQRYITLANYKTAKYHANK